MQKQTLHCSGSSDAHKLLDTGIIELKLFHPLSLRHEIFASARTFELIKNSTHLSTQFRGAMDFYLNRSESRSSF